jgi:hypothetical protein
LLSGKIHTPSGGKESRIRQRHGLQSTTLTSYFSKIIITPSVLVLEDV